MFEVSQYSAYLSTVVLTKMEEDILVTLSAMYPDALTTKEIATLIGISSLESVNSVTGRLGHKISDHLGVKPTVRQDGTYRWWTIIADGNREHKKMFWKLNVNLREALSASELRMNQAGMGSDLTLKYTEGSGSFSRVKRYERNPKARERCIEHWGCMCQICGFDFYSVYGEVGKGFIHVHHIVPVSEIDTVYEIDPEKHLVPLCPNCHAIVHKENPPYTVEQVKEFIAMKNKGT